MKTVIFNIFPLYAWHADIIAHAVWRGSRDIFVLSLRNSSCVCLRHLKKSEPS